MPNNGILQNAKQPGQSDLNEFGTSHNIASERAVAIVENSQISVIFSIHSGFKIGLV